MDNDLSKDLKIIHQFENKKKMENTKDKDKNKTDFITKSLHAYSTEILDENIAGAWHRIANDVFGEQ